MKSKQTTEIGIVYLIIVIQFVAIVIQAGAIEGDSRLRPVDINNTTNTCVEITTR